MSPDEDLALLDLASIPEEVATFEALAVWCFQSLARKAQGRILPVGAGGEMVPACSMAVVEAADGRTFARLEAFPPCSLAELNAPGEKTWQSAGPLVGSSGPLVPPSPPPPPLDPVALLSPVVWYDFSDASVVTLEGASIRQVTDKGSAGVNITNAAASPTLVSDANGRTFAQWPNETNSFGLKSSSSTSFQAAEVYIVCSQQGATSFRFGWQGLLTNAVEALEILLVGYNDGFEGPYAFNRVYINGRTTNSFSYTFPHIASTCLLRVTESDGTVVNITKGFHVGMDRANGNRGWRGSICEIAVFPSLLSQSDRAILSAHLAQKWGFALV